ncbi:hypothetical protein P3T76_015591 [Phytophthora citrophthora]|uniref:Uncharacterized protein n=1 Tax=Phytophthora citrophthora TaxID=4793 RepID=A0AAD9FZ32_9STRA|nr:hypothetical protein P3T76_015591 [Phytophthora citrophthora]
MIELIEKRLLDIKLYRHATNNKDDNVDVSLKQLHDVYRSLTRPIIRHSRAAWREPLRLGRRCAE